MGKEFYKERHGETFVNDLQLGRNLGFTGEDVCKNFYKRFAKDWSILNIHVQPRGNDKHQIFPPTQNKQYVDKTCRNKRLPDSGYQAKKDRKRWKTRKGSHNCPGLQTCEFPASTAAREILAMLAILGGKETNLKGLGDPSGQSIEEDRETQKENCTVSRGFF